jgi:hypothetical protein
MNLLCEAVRILNRITMMYCITGIPYMPHRHSQNDQGKVICFFQEIKNPGFGSFEEMLAKMKRELSFDDSPDLLGIMKEEQRVLHLLPTTTKEART